MVTETMRTAFARTASELLDEDPRAAIVLAEISTDSFTGVERRHPDRVVNVGIMEQAMVGVAAIREGPSRTTVATKCSARRGRPAAFQPP